MQNFILFFAVLYAIKALCSIWALGQQQLKPLTHTPTRSGLVIVFLVRLLMLGWACALLLQQGA